MTNPNTLSAEQDKFEDEMSNIFYTKSLNGENCTKNKNQVRDFLLASNQRVRLQTLQEVQGMIEAGRKTEWYSDRGEHEANGANKALSDLAAKLSALIEQEK